MCASPVIVEICPNCGKSTAQLDEYTGWCAECSPQLPISTTNGYLQANADKLEHYISQGNSLDQAVELLADPKNGHRPTCIVCGAIIKHAPKISVFCRKNPECRRMSRRYIYLYTKRGMSKSQALAQILSEVT